jgi:hypothetical protein
VVSAAGIIKGGDRKWHWTFAGWEPILIGSLCDFTIRASKVARFTRGFASPYLLEDHFDSHRSDFDAASEEEYEDLADEFLGGRRRDSTLECKRTRNGDVIRYDTATREFGIVSHDGIIKTYFKPNPAIHGEPTNLEYFHKECRK